MGRVGREGGGRGRGGVRWNQSRKRNCYRRNEPALRQLPDFTTMSEYNFAHIPEYKRLSGRSMPPKGTSGWSLHGVSKTWMNGNFLGKTEHGRREKNNMIDGVKAWNNLFNDSTGMENKTKGKKGGGKRLA